MSAPWFVHVAGQNYGPYSEAQLATFVSEGRLGPQSLVAYSGDQNFRAARDVSRLAHLFESGEPSPRPAAAPRGDAEATFGRLRNDSQRPGQESQLIIMADMKSRSIDLLEDEISKLGQFFSLLPQVWLLRTDQTVNAVRNKLVLQLGKLDRLFVADATNNKSAWFNFGPEIETRVRRVWSRRNDPSSGNPDRGYDYHP
jgi:hypothetical protein